MKSIKQYRLKEKSQLNTLDIALGGIPLSASYFRGVFYLDFLEENEEVSETRNFFIAEKDKNIPYKNITLIDSCHTSLNDTADISYVFEVQKPCEKKLMSDVKYVREAGGWKCIHPRTRTVTPVVVNKDLAFIEVKRALIVNGEYV